MCITLFGGATSEQCHNLCKILIANRGVYSCEIKIPDQPTICNNVAPVFSGEWTEELDSLGINVSDNATSTVIELLIGADVAGKLYTGRRHQLQCSLVALETFFGWTLMGKLPVSETDRVSMSTLSLFAGDISGLSDLDVLGITDPCKTQTRNEIEAAALDHFMGSVKVNNKGRYEVKLPFWMTTLLFPVL